MTPHHLHLLTLGTPLLLAEGGEPVRFRTRKHFALLIRLAVEAGRKFTRDYLVDLLWSDAPPQRASHSLAQAISVLKAKVGREHVLVQKATVALADGVVDADVRRLDGRNVEIRGPFLDGFEVPGAASFEQWKDERRARLMAQLRDCLVTQMDAGRRVGDFGTVERHALVLHDLDPLSEDAVRGLMEARAWVGDRSNALKVFGRFEARLAEELGAKPSPDLVRIADLLREGRGAAPRRHGEEAAPEPRERRFEAETLIGREREFSALYDAWLEARRRTPRIIVLTGDPGVGKTTLTNAFLSTCQMEGAVVARAQAYDAERELPFAVLAELVKQLALQRAIGGADPEALAELTRVSPEIPRAFPGVPKPPDWSADVMPLRFADAFLKMVEAAAEESPLVVVVDDIHASDNASAAILHMVARKLPRTRLLLILTGRPSELRMAAAPAALVTDSTVEALRPLELEPLGPEAAARLVAAVATAGDASRGEPPTERILRASRGNPLAIELLTREWASQEPSSLLRDLEAMDTQPVASLGIPRAIGAVFERQVRRLDAASRAALDLAAVLGRRLSDLRLYDAVNLNPGQTMEALARLTEEGLLREVRGELEFRNELIRAQAYYSIAASLRQQLHKRVADLLAARTNTEGKGSALEIAWQYLRGGDPASALPLALEGAETALREGAPAEAERILAALVTEPTVQASIRAIRLSLAKALLDQSKATAALPILDELSKGGTLTKQEFASAARMRAAAEYLVNQEQGTRYCDAARQALVAARESGDLELLAGALFDYARSGVTAGQAVRLSEVRSEIQNLLLAPEPRRIPMLLYTRGYCHFFARDIESALADLTSAIRLLAPSSNVVEQALAHAGYGVCARALCHFEDAERAFLTALDLSLSVGDDSRGSVIAVNLSQMETLRGNYSAAIEYGLRSVELGRRALNQPKMSSCYLALAESYVLAKQETAAIQNVELAREWMQRERALDDYVVYCVESAGIALMMGNLSLALTLLEQAERAGEGRELVMPDPGVWAKFKIFRGAHVRGLEWAWGMAREAQEAYQKVPLDYASVLAAVAWLERQSLGQCSRKTRDELDLFRTYGLSGKVALLRAQGFLE